MAKKDFSDTRNRVQSTLAEATAEPDLPGQRTWDDAQEAQEIPNARKERRTYSEQEAQEFMNLQETSGRKGLKLPRINMAFSPENYEYIQTMARVRGETLTTFVNEIMNRSRIENQELYQEAVEFRKRFKA